MNKLTEWLGKAVLFRWLIVGIIVLSAMIWGYFIITENVVRKPSLPVYGVKNNDSTDHVIAVFSLTDQNGKIITEENFSGKIYVADFFFANCEGICPVMSSQMERVAENYRANTNVMFLSHSVKPEEDSVPVLKEYAEKHQANDDQWHFVTGKRSEINTLARSSYLLVGEEDDGGIDFVHTPFFALIDTQKRIRGFYDGTDSTDVNKLIGDINILLNEE